ELLYFISRWKNAGLRPPQALEAAQTDKEYLAARAYQRYQNTMKISGALDFDDLLLCTEELLTEHPKVRREEAERFDHLLVDEYQDTNALQYRIAKTLAAGHRNICVVGDDDQSIYSWRGAESIHILRFADDWPDAKVVRLEVNYRSTHQIIDHANRLIAFNKQRHEKLLRATFNDEPPQFLRSQDEHAEAQAVVDQIAARIASLGRKPRDFAILCRTNEQPRVFETELRRANIPYVLLGGMSFYDRKEVRDVLAYLKLLANPDDEISLLRIINLPARGISKSTVRRLLDQAIAKGAPIWSVLPDCEKIEDISAPAKRSVEKFRRLIEEYQKLVERRPLVEAVKKLLHEIGYKQELARQYPDAGDQESRWASVEELINALAIYTQRSADGSLSGFLQETALVGDEQQRDKESRLKRDAVALMTLHAAKGLEFREVYMVGMEEGLLPHHRSLSENDDAVDEERRLCYVGVTRAKRRLTLSRAMNRNKWGKLRPTIPSRFLYELKGSAENPRYLEILRRKDPAHAAPIAVHKNTSRARQKKTP
ncbi:MAG: ATP-dependent helicase, partial [Thermoguttaceae bacterium]